MKRLLMVGVAVAMFLSYAGQLLITANPVFTSIVLLVFMVLITTLVFALVFGKPLTMYLDGERTEAVYALWMTFIVIFVLAGLAMVTAVFIK